MAGKCTLKITSLTVIMILLMLFVPHIITSTTLPQTKKTLCTEIPGRLGNTLYRVAALYAIAQKTNVVPSVCAKSPVNQLFEDLPIPTAECNNDKCLRKGTKLRLKERASIIYIDGLTEQINAINDTNVKIFGRFRNLRYFSDYMESIKAMYKINEVYKEKAQNYLHSLSEFIAKKTNKTLTINEEGKVLLNEKPPVFITVHVRRTDMVHAFYCATPGPSYFEKAMNYMRQKYGSEVAFVVLTDDVRWSKANIKGNDVYFTGEKAMLSKEEDFSIGVVSNHTVMSVGTFGWWMSFLSGGDVIYFKDWAKGFYKDYYVQNEVYPESWTPMGE